MMISKTSKRNNRGSLSLPMALTVVGSGWAIALLVSSMSNYKHALRGNAETAALMHGHGIAALLKEDVLNNYNAYADTLNPKWDACRTNPVSVREFVNILDKPETYPAACQNVTFSFSNFTVEPLLTNSGSGGGGGAFSTPNGPNSTVSSSQGTAGDSATTSPQSGSSAPIHPTVPTELGLMSLRVRTLAPSQALNQFQNSINISSFNTDPSRLQLVANLALTNQPNTSPFHKQLQVVIDVGRTVSAPARSLTAKMCRAVIGSVCDSVSSSLNILALNILDQTGRIMNVSFNTTTFVLVMIDSGETPDLRAQSVKNLHTTRTNYYDDSFCMPSQGNTAVRYVIDSASNATGNSYFLTVHGRLVRGDGTDAWAVLDPKFVSIANDNSSWLLLRSDGAVFRSSDVENAASMTQVAGLNLPMARSIATGAAPAACP